MTIYADASHQVPVLVVVRPVAAGAEITAADLGEDGISSSGSLDAVPASQASTVVGRLAGVPLAPGSLLALSEVTSGQPIKAGDAVVGIALKDGQLPASGLQPGDQVMVVQTNAPGSPVTASSTVPSSPGSGPTSMAPNGTGSSTGVLVPVARVTTVAQPASGSSGSETELVSVEVSETLAAQVSVAAAADQVSLVLVPGNGGAS